MIGASIIAFPNSACIQNVIEEFKAYRASAGLSSSTLMLDGVVLRDFIAFCHTLGIETLNKIDRELIDRYFRYLYKDKISVKTGKNLTFNSIRKYYDVLRMFEAYLVRRKNFTLFIDIRKPPVTVKVTKTFSLDQLVYIIERSNPFYGLMFRVLINTGLRISEVLGLEKEDVFLEESQLLITNTKTKKDRVVPVSGALVPELRSHLQQIESNRVFPVSSSAVRKYLARIKHSYPGLFNNTEVRPHVFRHTFAKHWIMNDGDPISLQRILGHSSGHMTSHYVQLFSSDLRKKHEKYALLI
ncbi:tyrosine-type recombinase/integrase [Paenibacillus macerans]|uniref:Phage integrase family protein n=1 Tax=Paenibacillus macerans TaxID=44252 RepID=A0A090Y466_PAEMA|nr:site-specific integrase [Paenibacillus macerans]KFM93006.1 phage integrase family protein [Paenibacillus macerans]MCY7558534.1 tyrosine-type recombinase/integrase [Paenibacillus macerans]MEC0153958.1 site-specific integrase [Paenibacillus macerans]SUA84768.1 tyrosine recombinase XerD [Paenibacillus macerans]